MKDQDTIILPSGNKLTLHIADQQAFEARELMDPASKDKWVAALESGVYRQGQGGLFDDITNSFCCLGVKAEIDGHKRDGRFFRIHGDNYSCYLAENYEKGLQEHGYFIGFALSSMNRFVSLAELNDKGYEFKDIAHVIKLLF
jgi:hypothetical protein